MAKFVTVLVEVLIFTTVIGVIAQQVGEIASHNLSDPQANYSATSIVLIGLVTLFVVIGFIIGLLKTLKVKGGR